MDKKSNPGSKILIVDDETIILDTLHAFLMDEDYEFLFAVNGEEAIKKVNSTPPDVILLDIMMPGIDGFEVCQRLKSDPATSYIPIILVTALDSTEEITRGLDSGADEFISKPVDRRELKARVRSMLRIKHQYDDLENTIRLRDDLSNLVVHDMRSPLNIIMGHGEMLLNVPNLQEGLVNRITKINEQSERLNKLINEMLMIARMEQGKMVLNLVSSNLNQVIERVVSDHKVIAEARNLNITLALCKDGCSAVIDEHLMSRVIDNLLSNALKFSPAYSEIKIQTTTFGLPQKPALGFMIFDQGPGISSEFQEEIFEKYKVVALKKAGVSQVGLGLFFCKLVIEAHQGRIWVENNKPLGSVFCFEIPVNHYQSV